MTSKLTALGDIRSFIFYHPMVTHMVIAPILAFFTLTPTPQLLPVILLVASLRVWTQSFLTRSKDHWYGVPQLFAISLAGGAGSLGPSLRALSSPTTSIIVLSGKSLLTSLFALFVIAGATRPNRLVASPWSKHTLFPAIWASAWGFISYVSPIGLLATWSPVSGLGPYGWIRLILGQWGIDWVVGAWAVVASEAIGDWLMGPSTHPVEEDVNEPTSVVLIDSDEETQVDNTSASARSVHLSYKSWTKLSLTAILAALMLPSYALFDVPLPANSADTTPFTVACASPLPYRTGHRTRLPTLGDYIKETKTLQTHANLILWPETAVRFDSPAAKQEAFAEIQKDLAHGKYVGVGFEDYLPSEEDQVSREALRRNGFALLGYEGAPVLEYYKRSLVPIAESYRFTPGKAPPAIFTINMHAPKTVRAPDWAPGPNFTRPIPITAAICLDFASPSTFAKLESKPALILAPASTWHTGIGYAMWAQAKARAAEAGSPVVWCDGGEGAVGGIVGGGYNEIVQVGGGSWTKTIGIQWPLDQRRTLFMAGGQSMAFSLIWAIVGAGWAGEMAFKSIANAGAPRFAGLVAFISQTFHRVRGSGARAAIQADEEQSLLD